YDRLLHTEHPVHLFYKLWTMKESYTKAVGKGLSIPLTSFRVESTLTGNYLLIDTSTNELIQHYTSKHYWPNCDYSIAVCAKNIDLNAFQILPEIIQYETLLEY